MPPPPPTDDIHGTDCEPWYLWAAEHMSDQDFRTTYRNRFNSIRQKNLGPEFQPFLDRLAACQN